MSDPRDDLQKARRAIDALDRDLLLMLQRRAVLALAAGRAKRGLGLPVLDEAREAEVLARLAETTGPLECDALGRIFRTIMEEMRKAELKG